MIPDSLGDKSSSAKLVWKCLHDEGALRMTELVGRLHLSENTVRSALGQLEDAGVVIERPVAHDARLRQYVLVETLDAEEPPAQRQLAYTRL